MTILFDLRSGVSGDMVLSALLQAYENEGKDIKNPVEKIEKAASVMSPTRIRPGEIERSGLRGYSIDVDFEPLDNDLVHGVEMVENINRGLREIGANDRIRRMSLQMIKNILEAEMKAHQCGTVEEVHLHETGTPDTLVDIIGISLLFDLLEFDGEWIKATPISMGAGTVDTSHGELEVPVPAVRAMIGNIPVRTGPVNGELATPTGVAAVKAFVEIWMDISDLGDDEDIKGELIGCGAGKREYPSFANMLRIWEVPS